MINKCLLIILIVITQHSNFATNVTLEVSVRCHDIAHKVENKIYAKNNRFVLSQKEQAIVKLF